MTLTKTVASAADGNVQLVELTDEEIAIFEANKKEWDDGANERAMANIRLERNAKLAASDWMASSDYTMSEDWKSHRQKLRDFPSVVDLENIVWPEEPE
jgi:hypothetical protein